MITKSLTFWTLVAGLLAFLARWYFSTFPFDEVTILSAILFVLGLIGIVPQLRIHGALTAPIVNSLAFWQLVAGFVAFVLHFWAPNFPFEQAAILAFILFVLGWFQIHPELHLRGLLKSRDRNALADAITGVAGENLKAGDAVVMLPNGTVKKSPAA